LDIYLVDGTYELFRHYYALPSARDSDGREVAAVRGVLASVLGMMKGRATHIAVATDHVIESFRNALWPREKMHTERFLRVFRAAEAETEVVLRRLHGCR
jgi:5'-3' exonuclease